MAEGSSGGRPGAAQRLNLGVVGMRMHGCMPLAYRAYLLGALGEAHARLHAVAYRAYPARRARRGACSAGKLGKR